MTSKVDYNHWHENGYETDLDHVMKTNSKLHNQIITALNLSPIADGQLLDIACGKGIFLKKLSNNYADLQLFGVDISEVAIQAAGSFVNAQVQVGDAMQLPYASNSFDYVTCLGGLEYLTDPAEGASEIHRVLKQSGRVCIQVPNLMFLGHIYMAWRYGHMPSEGGSSKDDFFYNYKIEKFYTLEGWSNILHASGLHVVKTQTYNLILGSHKVSMLTRSLFNNFGQYFVPKNLAYSFIFVCNKN